MELTKTKVSIYPSVEQLSHVLSNKGNSERKVPVGHCDVKLSLMITVTSLGTEVPFQRAVHCTQQLRIEGKDTLMIPTDKEDWGKVLR